jgi:hypothetical protein
VGTGKAGIAQDPDHKTEVRFSSSTFRKYIQSGPRFRALLTGDGDRMLFHREGFDRLAEVSA